LPAINWGNAHSPLVRDQSKASTSFLKKRSKKLLIIQGEARGVSASGRKSFLLLFFKKEVLFPPPNARDPPMLSSFRKFAGTWPARILFLVLVAAFASWGVADVARNLVGGNGAVATVQGHDIGQEEFMRSMKPGCGAMPSNCPIPARSRPPCAIAWPCRRWTSS